jgi:hypothetical protein
MGEPPTFPRVVDRAKYYRAQAWDARLKAAKSKGEMQAAFIKIAGQWEQLALVAELDAGND